MEYSLEEILRRIDSKSAEIWASYIELSDNEAKLCPAKNCLLEVSHVIFGLRDGDALYLMTTFRTNSYYSVFQLCESHVNSHFSSYVKLSIGEFVNVPLEDLKAIEVLRS